MFQCGEQKAQHLLNPAPDELAYQTAVVLRLAGDRAGFLKEGNGSAAMVEFLDCSSSAACCSMIRLSLAVSLVSKLRDVSLVTCKALVSFKKAGAY